jgi:hypothetical protein
MQHEFKAVVLENDIVVMPTHVPACLHPNDSFPLFYSTSDKRDGGFQYQETVTFNYWAASFQYSTKKGYAHGKWNFHPCELEADDTPAVQRWTTAVAELPCARITVLLQ